MYISALQRKRLRGNFSLTKLHRQIVCEQLLGTTNGGKVKLTFEYFGLSIIYSKCATTPVYNIIQKLVHWLSTRDVEVLRKRLCQTH